MTVKHSLLLPMFVLLMQPMGLFAAQVDSLAFNQGRTRIWCETARFIYEDNGADSLLATINCHSIETLKASIGSTDGSLGALRLLNSVDKPAIYAGFTSTEARLQKLVNEVVARLKSSPVRRANPARLSGVDSLQQQLMLVALQTGAPADDDYAEASTLGEEVDEQALPLPVNEAETEEATTDLPWNEILQWLTILLIGGFAIWRLLDLQGKYDRMKKDQRVLERQVNEFFYSNLQLDNQSAGRQEYLSERDVRQGVNEELQHNRPATRHQPAPEVKEVPLPSPPLHDVAHSRSDMAGTSPVRTEDSSEISPEASSSVNVRHSHPAERKSASGSPAYTGKTREGAELFYDKMPFKGGFHQNEMSRERLRDSLYTIQLVPQQPGEADYWITEDTEVQRYAMQNGLSFFEEGCEFAEVDENPARVVNERKGKLRKEGQVWKILQKAKVRFE